MKKIISIMLVCVMVLSLCIGCGTKKTGNGTGKKSTLTISVFDGGYGTEFLDDIASAFEAEYPYVDVVLEKTDLYQEIKQQIDAGRYVADLIISTSNFTQNGVKGSVLDITDVYDSYPYGEEGLETIREKLGVATDALAFEDKFYQIPVHAGNTGIVYNKVYLDAIFGEGKYTLPVTSNQFLEMCRDIKAKGGWASVYTTSTSAEYAIFLREAWTVQHMGYDAYKAYFDLSYYDEQGNLKKAETADEFHAAYRNARTSTFAAMSEFLSGDLGFVPPSAASMSYAQAQAYFVGFTSQTDVKVVDGHKGAAFMINGDWIYDEVKKYGEEVELDIRFMRTPINSAIVDNLTTVSTEEQLVECINYIDTVLDGAEGTKPAYLSDADYNRLYEARRMVWTTHGQSIACIPATCKDVELTKEFLKFMASDGSALMYSAALNGMRSIYNSEVCAESSQNEFTKSLAQSFKDPLYVTGFTTPYAIYGSLQLYFNEYLQLNLFKSKNIKESTERFVKETENKFTKTWDNIKNSYQE